MASPPPAPDESVPAGPLLAIGGAEDKLGKREVLGRFVDYAGGADGRIAVVPTASGLGPDVVDLYSALFRKLGAGSVIGVRPETRAEAEDPKVVADLDEVTGIFMTGGNQLKLSQVITGTAFGRAILDANALGVTVGGTSAGASILSSHMVAFGSGGATPKQRMTQLAAGLGLLDGCVIDQHFAQRNRYGRLLMLVAQSPALLGIGVDEDTAAIVHEGSVLEVAGRGVVTVMDGSRVRTNAHAARHTAPLLVSDAVLHVLPAGSVFDLTERTLLVGPPVVDPAVAADLERAGDDLRALARDIAAEGVSPTNLRRRQRRRASDRRKR
ncbi:MAG: cyanophycinase [Nocardioidaceae bacterium]